MLALAVQLYYAPGAEPEVLALIDEGLAVARRIDDPALRGWAARTGWIALWRVAHLDRRRALAVEEIAAARESGNEAAEALAHIALAGAAVEEGDLETWRAESAAAEDIARRRRLTYVEYALHFVRLNLTLLADDDEAADEHAEAMRTMRDGMATPAMEWNEFGVLYATASWRPGVAEADRAGHARLLPTAPDDDFGRTPLLHVLALAGLRATSCAPSSPAAPLPPLTDNWYVTSEASVRAVVAGFVGDEALARRQRRAPAPGSPGGWRSPASPSSPGRSTATWRSPLAVLGEREEATAFAERAEALASRWGMTAYLRWFAGRAGPAAGSTAVAAPGVTAAPPSP